MEPTEESLERPVRSEYNATVKRLWSARLATPQFVILFIVSVSAALFLLYPSQRLHNRLMASTKPDRIVRRYLQHIMYYRPDNVEYKLQFIRQELALGNFKNAERNLRPLLKNKLTTKTDWEVLFLYSIYLREEIYSYGEKIPQRVQYEKLLREKLPVLLNGPYNYTQFLQIADMALLLEMPAIANAAYGKIISISPQYGAADYAKFAKKALGVGNYVAAANLYFMAQKAAKTLVEQREYYMSGVSTLQSGNMLEQAIIAAEANIGNLKNDKEVLLFITNLALAANKAGIAQKYITKVVSP